MIEAKIIDNDRVYLKTLQPIEAEIVYPWLQDEQNACLLNSSRIKPWTLDSVKTWIEKDLSSKTELLFGIWAKGPAELVGYVEIDGIQWQNKNCGISYLLGKQELRRQGIATAALRLVFAYCFEQLGMHRLQVTIYEFNTASIQLVKKLGFRQEGVFREHIAVKAKRYDMILFGMLRTEWLLRAQIQ